MSKFDVDTDNETTYVTLGEYFIADNSIFLFIMRSDFEEPQVEVINLSADRLLEYIRAYFNDFGEDRWQDELAPLVTPLLSYTKEHDIIWIVPHEILHYLPFHALKIEGRYLMERNPVCYTPSASVMQYCHAQRKHSYGRALIIGDTLGDLLYARAEAYNIATLFATIPYVQEQATKAFVKMLLEQEGDQLDVLHFSCHAYFDAEHALKSGIVLAVENGAGSGDDEERWNLTAEEILRLRIRANIIKLSACETGISEYKTGDELIGLTRALIYAGTPSVIVSLWPVEALSTSLLMQHFYGQLRKPPEENNGQPVMKAEALRSAQRYVKDLTTSEVVEYCNLALDDERVKENVEQVLSLYMGRAYAQTIAGDLAQAMVSYQLAQNLLQTFDEDWAQSLSSQVSQTLTLLAFKAEDSVQPDYTVRLFEHFYYWAPFILVGDWR